MIQFFSSESKKLKIEVSRVLPIGSDLAESIYEFMEQYKPGSLFLMILRTYV